MVGSKKVAAKTKTKSKPAAPSASKKKRSQSAKAATRKASSKKLALRNDIPSLFRINVEVGNLDEAAQFYGELFAVPGRRQAGSRVYFDCGPVTLQVVDVSSMGAPHPAAKALYFTVRNLDAVFKRAQTLGCLSNEMVHGVRGGAITVRPWGERSFYAQDRWLNPLCFVEAGTVYPA